MNDHRGWADADLLRGWARDLGLRTPTRRPCEVAGLGPREAVDAAIEKCAETWLRWQFALPERPAAPATAPAATAASIHR